MIALMYHHANKDKFSNKIEMLQKHFKYISENYITANSPEMSGDVKSIIMVFDDAYYDFYYFIYPELKKYNLKVVLAVPTSLIKSKSNVENEKRLKCGHSEIWEMAKDKEFSSFCTWSEIAEMVDSGHVKVASHGHIHCDLTKLNAQEVMYELATSSEIIYNKLGRRPDSLVFPYGEYNNQIIDIAKTVGMKFFFGIGNERYLDRNENNSIIKRIYADDMVCENFFDKIPNVIKREYITYKNYLKSMMG